MSSIASSADAEFIVTTPFLFDTLKIIKYPSIAI